MTAAVLATELFVAPIDPYQFEPIIFVPSKNPFSSTSTTSKYIPINGITLNGGVATTTSSTSTTSTTTTSTSPSQSSSSFSSSSSLIRLNWSTTRGVGRGFVNLGVTCFVNATLQCLVHLPPLAEYCLSNAHSSRCKLQCAWCLLERQLVDALTGPRQQLSPPRFITKNFKLFAPRLNMNRQQDAHEFLRLVVDALQRAERSKRGTVVERIWGGKLRSRVQCSHCHGTSDTFEPLLDLSLELKGASLDTALRHFCKAERLAGDNAYRCERCKSLQSATKRLTIDEPPNALVVHLKRFQFSMRSGMKLNQMVEYGETLDLAPYISTPSAACRYRLTGVVVHSGSSMGSGHYYAFVRSGAGTWHQIDDGTVRTTSLQKALSQRAYILFYVRDKEQIGGQEQPQEKPQQQLQQQPQEQPPQQQPQSTASSSILTSLKAKLTKLTTPPQPTTAKVEQEPSSSPQRQWTLAISNSKGVWYQTPSNHNIFQTQRPLTMPFQPAAVDDDRRQQQNKRAMEEAEYDKGKQKKVRRKQEWDASVHNAFQATAQKKWRKKNQFKTRI